MKQDLLRCSFFGVFFGANVENTFLIISVESLIFVFIVLFLLELVPGTAFFILQNAKKEEEEVLNVLLARVY